MRCAKARRLIDLLPVNTPRADLHAGLDAHLNQCPACLRYQEQGQRLDSIMTSVPNPDFPSWMHERIIAEAASHDQRRVRYQRQWKLQTIPAAAAIILSLYLGSLVGIKSFNTNTTNTSSTTVESTTSAELASFGETSLWDYDYSYGGSDE